MKGTATNEKAPAGTGARAIDNGGGPVVYPYSTTKPPENQTPPDNLHLALVPTDEGGAP